MKGLIDMNVNMKVLKGILWISLIIIILAVVFCGLLWGVMSIKAMF